MKDDRRRAAESDDLLYITFDLQQLQPLPRKGCNEIGSTLLTLEDLLDHNKDKLIAWSDGWYGQNKNNVIVGVWMYFIKSGKFKQIEHKIPVVGQTMLDSDRDFGKIEIRLKREGNIYTVINVRKSSRQLKKRMSLL